MSGTEPRETPLAWSQSGDAFDVPELAVLWRVRRLIGNLKGGAPELVYGADGLPLMVDITIGPGEFMAAVEAKPGKYRLDALDELRKPVPGVPPAYFVVSAAQSPVRVERGDSATSDVAVRTLAEAFRHQSEKMGDVFKLQADQVIGLLAEFRQFLATQARPELPPAPAAPSSGGPRNAASAPWVEDNDAEDGDDQGAPLDEDEDEDEDEGEERDPDWFDRVQDFCAVVPAENLRVVGEMVQTLGPKVVGDGIRNVISTLVPSVDTGGKSGGGS